MNGRSTMSQISKFVARNGFKSVLLLVSAASLAACGTARPPVSQPVASTQPSITYTYTDDRALMDASTKAQAYCATYNSWPRTDSFYNKPEGGRNVTFVCDQPRTAALTPTNAVIVSAPAPMVATTTQVMPAQPVVSYSYRDDRGLVEATGLASRYCAGYAAQARSTMVQANVDGSKTITFDCVKTM
jgi:predicted small lipoprotein YifL